MAGGGVLTFDLRRRLSPALFFVSCGASKDQPAIDWRNARAQDVDEGVDERVDDDRNRTSGTCSGTVGRTQRAVEMTDRKDAHRG